jgi:hypothetical protein
MLALSTVMEINRLLKEGLLSQRQIAKRLGVSRGTVGAIASGQRPLVGKEPHEYNPASMNGRGQPQRCPRCGKHVYLPCQVCRTTEFIVAKRTTGVTSSNRGTDRETPRKRLAFPRCGAD